MELIEKRITVYVGEEPNDVDLFQKSEGVWIARGEYRGKQIEGEGSSAGAATTRWMEMARGKG